MTNEMTHDDIINKEIEEEHEFMRARIKELENKPTYPFNEAFNKQLQEENAFLKNTINHFAEIFGIEKPNYTTNKDFADFIIKVETKLQTKEQECKELEEKLIKISANHNDTLSIVEDIAIFLGLDKKDHFNIYQCYYELRELIENRNKEIYDLKKKKDECEKFYLTKYANKDSYCLELEHECEKLKSILQASDTAKAVLSSVKIYFPMIEKLSTALNEIEQICNIKKVSSQYALPNVFQQILDIINKTKEKQ